LRDQYNEVSSLHANVIVVAPSKYAFIEQYIDAFGPFPFPIYGDPSRSLYREMGHVTMPKWKLLSKAALAYVFGNRKDFIPEEETKKRFVLTSMKTQDIYIQGGTWLYSSEGKIIWKHIDQSPEDHASIAEVINQLQQTEQ
jgi:peroxiredoxin